MQRLEVSGEVRPIYGSLGVKRLMSYIALFAGDEHQSKAAVVTDAAVLYLFSLVQCQ